MSTSSLGAEIDALAARVDGPVLVPGDDGFDAEIAPFNLALTHSPDVVVGAASVADVAEAVRFAASLGLPVSAFAAGHGDAAVTVRGDGVDSGASTPSAIDAAARMATVGAGHAGKPSSRRRPSTGLRRSRAPPASSAWSDSCSAAGWVRWPAATGSARTAWAARRW